MTLREAQSLHVKLVSQLIAFAYAQGYELTWGETLRTKTQALANAVSGAGIAKSLHLIGLAVDLNLFKDGVYMPSSASHAPLGAFWLTLHPLCRWGGNFKVADGKPNPDGNHYSIKWLGVS